LEDSKPVFSADPVIEMAVQIYDGVLTNKNRIHHAGLQTETVFTPAA